MRCLIKSAQYASALGILTAIVGLIHSYSANAEDLPRELKLGHAIGKE
jgi:flagellar motor component MotA